MPAADEVLAELTRLRRGRGLREPNLTTRLGPELRHLCGVPLSEPDGPARARVATVLTDLAKDLPPDLRRAAEFALAGGDRPAARLTRRTEELALALHCSERTARRRMDEALALIATAAERYAEPVADGPRWRVRRFGALLRLDTPAPQLYETRTICAEQALDTVEITLDVPPRADADGPAGPLSVEAIHGARVEAVEASPDNRHYRVTVALGRPLRPAECLDFTLRYRLPAGERPRDHCVLVPLHPCDAARVRVRFGERPATVWRLAAVTPRQLDPATGTPGPDRVVPDRAGEVEAVFRGVAQGYAYGLAWRVG